MLVSELIPLYVSCRSKVVVDQGVSLGRAMRGLLIYWGGWRIDGISQAAFDARAAGQISSGRSPNSVRQELALLRAALRFGALKGYRPPVPPLTLPIGVTPVRFELTPREADRLLELAPDVETRCFMAIALTTGARRAAICELTWDRVDLAANTLDFYAPHEVRPPEGQGNRSNDAYAL